jgi:outer membrane protein OmpA-like peptidoglycan-associated protein
MPRSTGPGRVEVEPEYSSANSIKGVLYNFDVDGDELKSAHTEFLLRRVVPLLRNSGGYVFLLGSASRVGREDYNLRLSERRVDKVAAFLKAYGVAEYQMQRKAVGESLAIGPTPDDERHRAVALLAVPRRRKASVARVPTAATNGPRFELTSTSHRRSTSFNLSCGPSYRTRVS